MAWDQMGNRGSGTQADPGVTRPTAAKAKEIVEAMAERGIRIPTVYAGPRTSAGWGSGEHGSGRAIDIMVPSIAIGNAVNAYLKKNAERLGIKWVVWNHQIWNPDRNGGEPRKYTGTSNPHTDHLHVFFEEGAYKPPGDTPTLPLGGLFGMTKSIYQRRTEDQAA